MLSSEGGRWVVAKEMKDGSRTVALFNETGSAQHRHDHGGRGAAGRPRLHPARPVAAPELQHRRSRLRDRPAHGTVLLRVSADRHWAKNPPAVEVGLDGSLLMEAGKPVSLTSAVTDLGRTPARRVSVALSGPTGWKVAAASPTTAGTVRTGHSCVRSGGSPRPRARPRDRTT